MKIEELRNKIENGDYTVKQEYPQKRKDKAKWLEEVKAYRDEQHRLNNQFKKDALNATGLSNHPKAEKIFEYAYSQGHSSGYSEVLIVLEELAGFLVD